MKCELCNQVATEKHHITYFPERTIGVCAFHGDEVHRDPNLSRYNQYHYGDAKEFYGQKQRISKFLKKMALQRRHGWKR